MPKTEAHQLYRLADSTLVPGVTTVLGVLAKPALIPWAYKCGRDGIDLDKYRDEKAEIGHLAHQMILDHFRGEKTVTDDYSKNQIDAAENAFLSFLEWAKHHTIEPVLIEEQLVSEKYHFGGTFDFLGVIDGKLTLLDFKTGKALYDEYWYQLAGYNILVMENYPGLGPIERLKLVRIGRDEDEGFEEPERGPGLVMSLCESIFLHALGIYQDLKEMKGDKRAAKKAEKAKAKETKLAGKKKGVKGGKRTGEAGGRGGVDSPLGDNGQDISQPERDGTGDSPVPEPMCDVRIEPVQARDIPDKVRE